MKIAIVGTSKITDREEQHVRQICSAILEQYNSPNNIIISGGAEGVDQIALDVAKNIGFEIKEFLPNRRNWESFKKRNQHIANECDKLYCITTPVKTIKCYHHFTKPQDHQKTAGCWTLQKAKELGKFSKLFIIGED